MRQLLIVRHAHADAAGPDQADRDRPLSALGRREAQAAGQWLAEHCGPIDAVLCSPAQRTLATLEAVRAAVTVPTSEPKPEIYDASPGDLIRLLDAVADAERVLLVGHNPGLEELVALLAAGRSGDRRGLPPAGIVVIEVPVDATLEPGCGRVAAFWSP